MKGARIGRLIKLVRLLKMAKTIKQKENLKHHMRARMRLNVAIERLFFFSIFSLLFIHTISCLWIFLGVQYMERDDSNNWIDTFEFNV